MTDEAIPGNQLRPPVGTECADCKFHGHVCAAVYYVNRLPLCAWCADGVACPVRQAAVRKVLREGMRA